MKHLIQQSFRRPLAAAILAFGLTALPQGAAAQLALQAVATGLDRPIYVTAPPGDSRIFIVEQGGRVLIVENGAFAPAPFLDISGLVDSAVERGLLGLAFHPNYASNGRFFVNYTDVNGATTIAEFSVSADPGVANPNSRRVLLTIPQPGPQHNGGWLGFGPDGFLYIATGDGDFRIMAGAADPQNAGQDPNNLLGKILRIDVNSGSPYGIPGGNPWAGGGGAPEVFLIGLRNPWRASIDNGYIFIGDVGQNGWEEVNVAALTAGGTNFGWSIREGAECFRDDPCDQAGLTDPAYQYPHPEGCSVIGGYVYRGSALPSLVGRYVFSDYCTGAIMAGSVNGGAISGVTSFGELGRRIVTSFGTDAAGELYVTSSDGDVFKIVPQ